MRLSNEASASRRGLATLCLLVVAALALWGAGVGPHLAWGQEDKDLKALEEAAPAADAQPDAQEPTKDSATEKMPDNQLEFFFKALGWLYSILFLAISFTFVALIVMNALTLRRDAIVPASLVEGFEALLNEKKYQEAYDLAKNDDSFLGHVLSAGLAKLQVGYPQAIEAMQEVGEEENMRIEHRLSYIALIGTISPMVGLLGTVDGMVAAFKVIAQSDTQPKPSELAVGISTALITTLVGLWLAIPAVALFGFFRNRMARLVLEAGIVSEGLMSRFQKKP